MARVVGPNQFTQSDETTVKTAAGAVTAEGTSKTLVEANPNRVELILTNDGENAVYLSFGTGAAEAHKGPRLNKEGGSLIITGYSGKITCITATGTAVVSFAEV